jgi:hypothetical protein
VPRIGTLRLGACLPWRSPSRAQPHPIRPAVTIGTTGSPVPCQRLRRAHATSTPDTARTATRLPPDPQRPSPQARLPPGNYSNPRFRCHRSPFRCVISGSLTFVFFAAHLTAQRGLFPQRSPPRLLTAAACGGLGPPPDRRSRRASLHHRHSTVHDNDLLHRHQSPFRTHQIFGAGCAWAVRHRHRRRVTGSLAHLGGQITDPAMMAAGSASNDGVSPRGPLARIRVLERASRRIRFTLLAAAYRSGWSQMWSHSPGFAGVRQDPFVTVRPRHERW